MKTKPRTIFVDITIRSDQGRPSDLKEYVDAASSPLRGLATLNHAFIGIVGRRTIVSGRALSRHMYKHGFYRKAR